MIDFRYHLVSIIAVFLALAVGIVVGAEAVSPNFAKKLNSESQSAAQRNALLFAQNGQLKRQIGADNAFAQTSSGLLLAHLLENERVVIVTAPGADAATVTGITTALRRSGADVTGTVSLAPQFFDVTATNESSLTTTAGQLAPAGVSTSDPAGAQTPGQQVASRVIAAALMDKYSLPSLTTKQANSILTGFGDQGFLQISNGNGGTSVTSQATLAVVVEPASTPATASSLSPANLALIDLTHDLELAGKGALLAGSLPGSVSGSAIDAVTSGGAGFSLTTVDDADTAVGQVIVIQALRKLLGPHATATSYGVGSGTVPSPAPTTSPAPSPGKTHEPAGKQRGGVDR
ncbi:MAG TPA: copper transporter [Streptosporangiaceae bacterium]|nr:copper transporter [Streptosporangiaceae bacterium]